MSVNVMWESITVYCENKLYRKWEILRAIFDGVRHIE